MRIGLAILGLVAVAACADDSTRTSSSLSGEAARAAEMQARDTCAREGKRPQLRNVYSNTDGTRRYEFECVR
jgi:hypothetical protein